MSCCGYESDQQRWEAVRDMVRQELAEWSPTFDIIDRHTLETVKRNTSLRDAARYLGAGYGVTTSATKSATAVEQPIADTIATGDSIANENPAKTAESPASDLTVPETVCTRSLSGLFREYAHIVALLRELLQQQTQGLWDTTTRLTS